MESRKHNRTISPEESAELQELVFDLVRDRLLTAVGAGGMWTLQFRASTDTDSLFGETISEYIARDIANQIAAPSAAIDGVDESVELTEAAVDDNIQTVEENETPIVKPLRIDTPVPAAAEVQREVPVTADFVEVLEHDEHRMFKPRKAA